MTRVAPWLLLALAACGETEEDKTDDTQSTGGPPDTTPTGPSDTTPTTDTSDSGAADGVTIPSIRTNTSTLTYALGDILTVENVVVVGVIPSGDIGFFVQDPAATTEGGLFVDAPDITLPSVGDRVTVTGRYTEEGTVQPLGSFDRGTTRTELEVGTTIAGTSVTVNSSGSATPLPVPFDTYASATELYESMLIVVSGDEPLEVTAVSGASRTMTLADPGTVGQVFVGDELYPNAGTPLDFGLTDFGAGATFTSVIGVVWYDSPLYEVSPAGRGELAGYQPPPLDTGPSGDDTAVDTTPTGDTGTVPTVDTTPTIDTAPTPVPTIVDPTGDTFLACDTNTGIGCGGNGGGPIAGELVLFHNGLYDPYQGQYLTFEGLIVTGVRDVGSAKMFSAQDPDPSLTTKAGMWVQIGNVTPPEIGDEVDLVGRYDEWPNLPQGQTSPYTETLSTLQILPSDTEASWMVVSSGNPVPDAVTIPLSDLDTANCLRSGFCNPAIFEQYEGMRVTVEPMTPLVWDRSAGIYYWFESGAESMAYASWLFLPNYSWSAGASASSITGVGFFFGDVYSLAPTSDDDIQGYTP